MWKAENLQKYKELAFETLVEAMEIEDHQESVTKATGNALAIGLSEAIAEDLESLCEEIKAYLRPAYKLGSVSDLLAEGFPPSDPEPSEGL